VNYGETENNFSGVFSAVARLQREPIAFQPWAEKKHGNSSPKGRRTHFALLICRSHSAHFNGILSASVRQTPDQFVVL
jgi:hypothetical protein